MRIVVLTQEDSFSVPKNIEKIIKLDFVEVIAISNINTKSSLVNKKSLFINGFGLWQSFKMGLVVGSHKISDTVNKIFGYRLNFIPRSLIAVSEKYKIPFMETSNPNGKKFLEKMKEIKPDIIISYSAPVVFKGELLNVPQHSCINLHCSYLPNYAGVMPSFWTLYHNEKTTGCSVHYMDSKIDNGKILGQKLVKINSNDAMVDIIERTKEVGGELMCEVLININNGIMVPKDNDVTKGSYFTWPTVENFKDFRKKGGKLI